jgi:hypothetical protein
MPSKLTAKVIEVRPKAVRLELDGFQFWQQRRNRPAEVGSDWELTSAAFKKALQDREEFIIAQRDKRQAMAELIDLPPANWTSPDGTTRGYDLWAETSGPSSLRRNKRIRVFIGRLAPDATQARAGAIIEAIDYAMKKAGCDVGQRPQGPLADAIW